MSPTTSTTPGAGHRHRRPPAESPQVPATGTDARPWCHLSTILQRLRPSADALASGSVIANAILQVDVLCRRPVSTPRNVAVCGPLRKVARTMRHLGPIFSSKCRTLRATPKSHPQNATFHTTHVREGVAARGVVMVGEATKRPGGEGRRYSEARQHGAPAARGVATARRGNTAPWQRGPVVRRPATRRPGHATPRPCYTRPSDAPSKSTLCAGAITTLACRGALLTMLCPRLDQTAVFARVPLCAHRTLQPQLSCCHA